jgi:hypothetical protein
VGILRSFDLIKKGKKEKKPVTPLAWMDMRDFQEARGGLTIEGSKLYWKSGK